MEPADVFLSLAVATTSLSQLVSAQIPFPGQLMKRSFFLSLSILVTLLIAVYYAHTARYSNHAVTRTMSLSSKLSITDVSLKGEKVSICWLDGFISWLIR